MHCEQARQVLNAYLDEALTAEDRVTLQSHLAACSECNTKLSRLVKLGRLLTNDVIPNVPFGFAERVRLRAAQAHAPRRENLRRFRWRQAVAAAAMIAIGVSTGAYMGTETARARPLAAAPQAPADDPVLVYNLDYLGSTPPGSLPQAYLMLASAPVGHGE